MWELNRMANGNLSCDNWNLDGTQVAEVKALLANDFGDRIKEKHIMISWDCWSGIFIMLNPGFNNHVSANQLIKEIYDFLSERSK